ncbi:YbaK/EbsC family protein [candidate division KSB1 bacterium]|nr:YbaK/EbsC family protein [candidate division KSB1 bacterium]NIR71538.1 YbaK/EbsC family protein [candidate division KSB1 bacterium]NIS26334.1 YbaK/EbsC family protein [candidate division KSB1 bacterium]NIT73101.1 YbaK/EbsC family protein [candidate division KSB1 bacterium]NIU27017.1 YbaK/EbsC family protein [candidate division KSB1 bacterium]
MPQTVKSYLDENKTPYESIHHRRDYTAQETAADTHTKGKEFAKTVILFVDQKYCMAVLPAIYQVDLDKIKKELNAKEVNLATEEEISQLCRDCEIGAMPPFGNLYDLPVYVSHHLTEDNMITFNAGTHEDVIRMMYDDFEKLVNPKVLDMTSNHS